MSHAKIQACSENENVYSVNDILICFTLTLLNLQLQEKSVIACFDIAHKTHAQFPNHCYLGSVKR